MKRFALFSCSDKTGIHQLAHFFHRQNFDIIGTNTTYKELLKDKSLHHNRIHNVGSVTGFPEILDGRVKTLHPKIHAGILADRSKRYHTDELNRYNIPPIDVVVANLYPFQDVAQQSNCYSKTIENIDIGGVALIRAAAKCYKDVTVITTPTQYDHVMNQFDTFTVYDRLRYATLAFDLTSNYDSCITKWLKSKDCIINHIPDLSSPHQLHKTSFHDTSFLQKRGYHVASRSPETKKDVTRKYIHKYTLKYGCNPYQSNANVYAINQNDVPFEIINGSPSYINILDALQGWQLVKDLSEQFDTYAAASFKHTSPCGVAIVTDDDHNTSKYTSNTNDPSYMSYVKARNCDPMSSFGDFIAVSGTVTTTLANYISTVVSDGIIAENYDDKARKILSKKKGGKYIVLQASKIDTDFNDNFIEYRELCGIALSQHVNMKRIIHEHLIEDFVCTTNKYMSKQAKDDLILANCAIKYSQSNNVAIARGGQLLGISAGQQSRIHSVRLAVHKARVWLLCNDKNISAMFNHITAKTQDKINLKIRLIEHCLGEFCTKQELDIFRKYYGIHTTFLYTLSQFVKHFDFKEQSQSEVVLASDAFFPFRDSIDCASNIGISVISQPGGSVNDESVAKACDEYSMTMVCHGVRMFTH